MAEPQQKRRLSIPRDFNSEERQLLARRVIAFIQKRTDKGKGIDNESFPAYSKSYTESLDFEIAGKTKKVNLQQSGDTLASIELLSHGVGFITIGYEAGSFENDKATWLKRSDNGVSRKFLGITDDDLNKLIKQIESMRRKESEDNLRTRRLLNESIVQDILKRLGI
jgi:hypothetical protein